jgi:hypothetical protein
MNANAWGTSELAVGGNFTASGTGKNIGARFSASGGTSNTGIEVTSGAKISGGIDNNAGGISEAGAISGVTTLAAESLALQSKANSSLQLDARGIVFSDGKQNKLELRLSADRTPALSITGGGLEIGDVIRAKSIDLDEPLAAAEGGTGIDASSIAAKKFFASPITTSGAPGFRDLQASDLPDLSAKYLQSNAASPQANASFNIDGSGSLGGGLVVAGASGITIMPSSGAMPTLNFGERNADRELQFKDGNGNVIAAIADQGAKGVVNASGGFQVSGSAASGSVLRGNGSEFIASTASFPNTTAKDQLLYSSSENKITGLATSANGVLVTNAAGPPAIGNALPENVQKNITALGTITTGTWSATPMTDVNVSDKLTIAGGSINATPLGATTPSTGSFTALSANGIVTLSSLKSGIVRSNANGALSSSPITNADIANGAAISGSKINADFGSQEIRTAGGLNITSGTVTLGNTNSTVNIPGLLATGTVAPTALVTPNVYGGLAAGATLNLEGSNSKSPSGDRVTITTVIVIRATIDASGMKIGGDLNFTGGRTIAPVPSAAGYSLTISGGNATERNAGAKLMLKGGSGTSSGAVEINAGGGNVTIGNRESSTTIAGALNVTGGISNNRGGISDVGAISGVTSISASELTITSFKRRGVIHNDSRGELTSQSLDLAEDVAGVLDVSNGGTGVANVAPNLLFAGPAAGVADGPPSFRKLSAGDLPPSSGNYIQNQNSGTQAGAAFNIDGSGIIGGKMVVRGNAILGDSISDNVSILGLVNTSMNFASGADRSISIATSAPTLPGNGLSINAGNAGTGNGGSLTMNGGDAVGGVAGSVNINGGVSPTSTGGSLIVLAGTTSSGTGGSAVFAGGDASNSGSGGPTIIRGGHSKTGNAGTVSIHGGLVDGNAPSTVNINTTGTSGGNVMIGNGATMLTLNTANIDISPAGALSGVTGITSSGAITFSALQSGVVKSKNGNLFAGELNIEELPSDVATDLELAQAISDAVSGTRGKLAIFTSEGSVGDGDLRGDVLTNGSTQTSLSTTSVAAGSYGSSSSVSSITVDSKGRLTSASNSPIKAPAADLTGSTLAPTITASSLQSVGTITSGTWRATEIADQFVANDLTIQGGKIDATEIGSTTPRAGFFSGLSSTGVITGHGLLTLGNDNAAASRGTIVLEDATPSNTFDATIKSVDALSDDRTYTFPDASGTIALVESLDKNSIANSKATQSANFNISGSAVIGTSLTTPLIQSQEKLTLRAKSIAIANDLTLDGELRVGSGGFAARTKVTALSEGSQKFTIKNGQAHPNSLIILTPVTSSRGLVVPIAINDQSKDGQFEILANDMMKGETLEIYYLIVNQDR